MHSPEEVREGLFAVQEALHKADLDMVFVGGAVVPFYLAQDAPDPPRETQDLDILIQVAGPAELERVRQTLTEQGFRQNPMEKVVCRFRFRKWLVDVLSTRPVDWSPANPWFEEGWRHRILLPFGDDHLPLLPFAHFVAAKIEAFQDRGKRDILASKDLEDLVQLITYGADPVAEVERAPTNVVRARIARWATEVTADPTLRTAMSAHLTYGGAPDRRDRLFAVLADWAAMT